MTLLIFVVLLSLLIIVHELGHFILAKRAGVKVEEFAIGFPPRLLSIQHGETRYSLNLVPLGGYVKMLGEEDPTFPRSFAAARRRWRIAILMAGALMNIIAAVFLFAGAYVAGWPQVTRSEVIITEVAPDSPAEQAALQSGDVIVRFNGQQISTPDQLAAMTRSWLGRPVTLEVRRGQQIISTTLIPRTAWPSNQGPMGIAIAEHPLRIEPVRYPLPRAIVLGAEQTAGSLIMTLSLPVLVLRGLVPADMARPVGPYGIYQITSQAATETVATGWLFPLLSVAGTISAGLGLANLLPIPGLDGGRLLFVLIEIIRGRRVNPRREGQIHLVGLALLMSLVIVITYFDLLFPITIDFAPH
ncbi:MAG TPA: M50 family metallopeptidase [Chloroflexota bacterium]|nr:M50 family metallopeptidase [Chloroflexota bacterium]